MSDMELECKSHGSIQKPNDQFPRNMPTHLGLKQVAYGISCQNMLTNRTHSTISKWPLVHSLINFLTLHLYWDIPLLTQTLCWTGVEREDLPQEDAHDAVVQMRSLPNLPQSKYPFQTIFLVFTHHRKLVFF